MSYESGFARGERDAFADRRAGVVRELPADAFVSAEQRGYLDGYLPRSATWGAMVRSPEPVPRVWVEA